MKTIIALLSLLVATSAFAEPVKFLKSSVSPTFASDVARYAAELAEWQTHQARVDADKAAHVAPEAAYAPYPRPAAPTEIIAAIGPDGKPNFQIVNDDPTSDEILTAKKKALQFKVGEAEAAAVEKVLPTGKFRLLMLRKNKIVADDAARTEQFLAAQPDGYLAHLKLMGPVKDRGKAETDAVRARPKEDADFMANESVVEAKVKAINMAAAQMQSDIEDLTTANIDQWQIPPFPQ